MKFKFDFLFKNVLFCIIFILYIRAALIFEGALDRYSNIPVSIGPLPFPVPRVIMLILSTCTLHTHRSKKLKLASFSCSRRPAKQRQRQPDGNGHTVYPPAQHFALRVKNIIHSHNDAFWVTTAYFASWEIWSRTPSTWSGSRWAPSRNGCARVTGPDANFVRRRCVTTLRPTLVLTRSQNPQHPNVESQQPGRHAASPRARRWHCQAWRNSNHGNNRVTFEKIFAGFCRANSLDHNKNKWEIIEIE